MAESQPLVGQKLKLPEKATEVSYFSKFLLHQVAYDLEKNFENFPGMLGLPEGRDRATPIIGEKLNVGYFFKIVSQRVAYDLERLFKNFSDIFGQPEGRGRAVLFFSQNSKLDI